MILLKITEILFVFIPANRFDSANFPVFLYAEKICFFSGYRCTSWMYSPQGGLLERARSGLNSLYLRAPLSIVVYFDKL